MSVLIIHHLEPEWEPGYVSHGTSFEELVMEFRRHLKRKKYKEVILTRFSDHKLDDSYNPIRNWITRVEEYSYGWDEESKELNPQCVWAEGGTHSQYVLIDEWMLDLPKKDIWLTGAFDGECIEDMEIALAHCEVDYKRIESLIR